jgi:hypothetical protein
MSLATLAGSKVSVIEPESVTVIQFAATELALSALVKHRWVAVGALDRYTILFQNPDEDTAQHIAQLKMSARLEEKLASRRALSRLALEAAPAKSSERTE